MSVMIESTDELLKLLKKLDLKVTSVDELRQLLASINASYNPDAARQNTGKQIGTVVPITMASTAAVASMIAVHSVGGLAVVWGSVALASTAAVIAGALLTGVRLGRSSPNASPDRSVFRGEPVNTNIIKDLSV